MAAIVDDVDEIRRWLGYEKVNLVGGSYGAWTAQVYLRRHPEAVRTVALWGVVPMDEPIPLSHAAGAQRSLDQLLGLCEVLSQTPDDFMKDDKVRPGPDPGVPGEMGTEKGRRQRRRLGLLAIYLGARPGPADPRTPQQPHALSPEGVAADPGCRRPDLRNDVDFRQARSTPQ